MLIIIAKISWIIDIIKHFLENLSSTVPESFSCVWWGGTGDNRMEGGGAPERYRVGYRELMVGKHRGHNRVEGMERQGDTRFVTGSWWWGDTEGNRVVVSMGTIGWRTVEHLGDTGAAEAREIQGLVTGTWWFGGTGRSWWVERQGDTGVGYQDREVGYQDMIDWTSRGFSISL